MELSEEIQVIYKDELMDIHNQLSRMNSRMEGFMEAIQQITTHIPGIDNRLDDSQQVVHKLSSNFTNLDIHLDDTKGNISVNINGIVIIKVTLVCHG